MADIWSGNKRKEADMEPLCRGDRIKERYEVLKVLAGGMGYIYVAYDHEHREAVAIKAFQDEYVADRVAVARFTREAEIWVKLEKHRNIVRAKYVMEIQGRPHIILEYVPGGDLRSLMKGQRLPIASALELGMDFCRGMDFAHRKLGIVHRDIKPENCMLTLDRVLKITDFGIAAFQGELLNSERGLLKPEAGSLTGTGSFIGTIPYASPEQFRDVKRVDTRSDIYSFGIMLYEMLSGRVPFEGEWYQVLNKHLRELPANPRDINAQISRDLDSIVMKCLAKNKEERFRCFDELEQSLQRVYRLETGGAYQGVEVDQAITPWELLNEGASLSSLGMDNEAIGYFDRALDINPRYDKAWFNKGASLFSLGRNDEAIICNDKALKINPRLAEAWSNKGVSLLAAGRKNEALKCFDRALKIKPGYDDALINRGLALNSLGKYDRALQSFDRAISISPRYAKAWHHKGQSLSFLGREKEAILCYTSALDLNPRIAEAWADLGLSNAVLGYYDRAIECYDRALGIEPRGAGALANKVFSLSALGRDREACECLQELEKLNARLAGTVKSRLGKQ